MFYMLEKQAGDAGTNCSRDTESGLMFKVGGSFNIYAAAFLYDHIPLLQLHCRASA